MKSIKLTLVVLFAFFTANTFAQSEGMGNSPSLSVGLEVGLPTGDFNQTSKVGIGGSLKAAIPIFDNGDFTLSAGYISYGGKDFGGGMKASTVGMIPIKAGLRVRSNVGLYFEPQLGYTWTKAKGQKGEGGFTYAANVGYMFTPNWDISARYEGLSISGGTISQIGFRLAYSFPL